MSKQNNSGENLVVSARPDSVELVVYQGGDAVVDETRTVELVKGKNNILLEGLPAQFVENSFEINEATGPGQFKLGADCFTPADLSTQALLQKALKNKSKVTFVEQTAQGVLRHTGKLVYILGNQVVLEVNEGVLVLPLTNKFELSELPRGLSETPSLTLEPTVSEPGSYQLSSIYETGGLSWAAQYIVHYNEKDGEIRRLRCRVKLSNETGADFTDAQFRLLAAYNTSRARQGVRKQALRGGASLEAAQFAPTAGLAADSAQVDSVGEQKLYTLPEALSIRNGQTKRPYLLVTEHVPVRSEFFLPQGEYYPRQSGQREEDGKLPVFVRVLGTNDSKSKLGLPLPSGEVALFQPDSNGKYRKTDPSLYLGAVADGEGFKLELTTPSADIKAQRELLDWNEDPAEEETEELVQEPDFHVKPQGGPRVGTPEWSLEQHAEVAEAAETDGENKKRKPKPRFRTESRRVTIFNFKDKAVPVQVHESLPGKFELTERSQEFVRQQSGEGTFVVNVPAKGKVVVNYGLKWQIN